ncbi:MAG TPA: GH92 family glycosyl hydrolase [Verrucomicrobiae bacterium]
MKIPFKYLRLAIVAEIFFPWLLAIAGPEPVDSVSPLIGTGDHGHTYPGATAPFGFVQLSPDTRVPADPWTLEGWDGCSGYHYSDSYLMGFSHTHLSGTGRGDFGDILVMPVTGGVNAPFDAQRFHSHFSHDKEFASPGYYRVWLDDYDIQAELTATAHAGMHRYTFPVSEQSHLLVDLVHGIGNKCTEAALKVESSNVITGFRHSNGWATNRTIYFVIEFSQPFASVELEQDGKLLPPGQIVAKSMNVRACVDYRTPAGQRILLRVGLSPTSIDEAKMNLQKEIPTWDFDAVRQAARKNWNENLSRIQIETPDPTIRRIFYTALYHTMTAPQLYNNVDGSYLGPDKQTHSGSGFQFYSTMSLWDTFRAEHPLLTLLQPGRVNDFIQTLLVSYQESPDHALPSWPLAGSETSTMIGYHSVPVIYDAYQKGFRGFDAKLAYQAMTNTALSSRNRQGEYQKLGYVPWVKDRTEAVSRTLEFAYDDWCIAQMAGALGKTADEEMFARRAENYKNVWDPKTKFFRAKNPDGSFHKPFDPKEVATADDDASGSYTEADAWQYMFAAFQDVPGMIRLYGGDAEFIKRLDQFFDEDSDMTHWRIDVTGLVGQYAHGNEPDQHTPYLYALAGAQYKTARRVREIQLMQYDDTPAGICGNDDCGQISAWYVWSALGLYPLNPASGIYVIGSPLVEKAEIRLDPKFYPGARDGIFTVIADNVSKQNCYIESATLDGRPLNHPWVTHQEIAAGGTLELEMGILPNKRWWQLSQFENRK